MKRFLLSICLCFVSWGVWGQDWTLVEDLERPDTEWEKGFRQRVAEMWGDRIAKYKTYPNDPTEDCGKRYWSRLLAKMSFANQNPVDFSTYIQEGRALVEGRHVGSFRKPFSCAGYAMYFFHWKDSILKYDPMQVDLVYARVDTMWHYLLRTDHLLDACCGYNEQGGKEFNSENFQWMLKSTGYLFSHELDGKKVQGRLVNMRKKDLDKIEVRTGKAHPYIRKVAPVGVDVIHYFEASIKNLTRALYNAGRLEWNSNNYFGHTLNPLHTLYECAFACNDSCAKQNAKRAKACIDWMMVEAAIHYRDGSQVAADARAKHAAFLPFKGSYYAYTIPYFSDNEHYPSFGPSIWTRQSPGDAEIGFLSNSSYRPARIMIDLAQHDFDLPVEIQSAKPHYHIDCGRYFNADGSVNGEAAYADWKGTGRGQRFEFETIYIARHFTMASAAVGRPDGTLGTFSEQSMWRLGIDGQHYGARMLSGNAGPMTTTTGRYVWHEIGQYRNMMMQLVKSPEQNRIWVAVPDSLKELQLSGTASFGDVQKYCWNGNDLYLHMGHDVYIAIKPSSGCCISIDTSYTESPWHSCVVFHWKENTLGALVIEVGDKESYQSFERFMEATVNKKVKAKGAMARYTSGLGNEIRMKFMPPVTYQMIENTFDTPYVNPLSPAGTYPQVWGDGQYIDYMSWDSYRTVYGKPVITQKWGSGEMLLHTHRRSARIVVDPQTAEVFYYEK